MKKRLLSLIIVLCMIVQPIRVMANIQIPVDDISIDDVHYIVGQDVVTGKPIIRPTMTVSWQEPNKWSGDLADADYHTPDYYDLRVNNKTSGLDETINIDSGTAAFTAKSIDVHDEIVLDTGSLYEVSIQPYHFHTTVIDGEPAQVLAPTSGAAEIAYAITDLNVELNPEDDSIEVIWDDIGINDYEYRIVYAVGDYSTKSKQELINNKEGEITNLSIDSGKISQYYDTVKKRKRLTYKLEQNIYPGQIYSIMVEPITEYYNGKPIVKNVNYPYIWTCSTNIDLKVFEDGEYVRLEWQIPANFKVGQSQSQYELVEAKLVQYVNDQPSNIAIFDKDAATMEYYRVPRPSTTVEYQLQLRYEAVSDSNKIPIEPQSQKVPFVPMALKMKPTKPFVPSLMTQSILNDLINNKTTAEIKTELETKYLVIGDSYSGNISDLLDAKRTFHVVDSGDSINFVWGAFKRKDLVTTSPTYGDVITDTDVYYDIYVTKDLDSLAGAKKIVDNQKYDIGTPNNILQNTADEIVGFKYNLEYYYDSNETELQRITPDSLYYIKIVAKKKWGDEESVSEPTIVSLYYGYNGDSYEPPSVVKPPLKVKDEDTTTTEIALIWKEQWWEIIATNTVAYDDLDQWTHQVWLVNNSGTPEFHTQYVDGAEYFPFYDDESKIDDLINRVRQIEGNNNFDVIRREVDLGEDQFGVSDVKYKFYKIPFNTVQEAINLQKESDKNYSFVDYYNQLINDDKSGVNTIGWQDIEVTPDVDDTSYLYYKQDALLPNTLYLFMVYPYRELYSGEVVLAHYPTPIVVATKPEDTPVTPDPTVPSLYINDYTDTTMTLTWKYNTNFQYEIRYSLTEDVEGATVLDWKLPTDPLDPLYPTDGAFYEVIVDDLFPDTEYYFWIRSIQAANNNQSPWSNVAIGTTKDVDNPLPPKGIGIASSDAMKKHDYMDSITEDYIGVEWILHPDDKPKPEGDTSTITKSFTYLMEVSDNALFIDPIYIEIAGGTGDVKPDNVEILEKYLVKINKLIANRFYYVRMKTRVTVTGPEQGQLIVKDSLSYSDPIRILTKYSSSEYDGHTDPALEVLPGEDYEIIYDKEEKELTYRFRTTGTGNDNLADNNVDQRLIMNLIKQNVYVYEIDVSNYQDNPIVKRKVLIPYSIIQAFDSHKVKIVIKAGDMTLEIPYDALRSTINKQVSQYGAAPLISFHIDQYNSYYIQELMPEDALVPVGIPQELGIYVKTSKGTEKVSYTDKEMVVNVKAKQRYELYGKEVITYRKDAKYNKWQDINGKYSTYSGDVTFTTGSLGVFGLYVTDQNKQDLLVPTTPTHWSESARKEIVAKYTIKGLSDYNPDGTIMESQLLNIIYSMLTKERIIDLGKYIDKNTLRQLTISGISQTGTTNTRVTRESGFNMFVRVYEIMNDQLVEYDATVLATIQKNSSIDVAYKESIAKAIKLGLISDIGHIRAKDSLTFGEMFQIWSKLD